MNNEKDKLKNEKKIDMIKEEIEKHILMPIIFFILGWIIVSSLLYLWLFK